MTTNKCETRLCCPRKLCRRRRQLQIYRNPFLSRFHSGVNLGGFDWGLWGGPGCVPPLDPTPVPQRTGLSYYCIPNSSISWNNNHGRGARVMRFPISPTRIFNTIDNGPALTDYFLAIFTGDKKTSYSQCDNRLAYQECPDIPPPNRSNQQVPVELTVPASEYSSTGNFMSAVRYANRLGIYTILDLHDNARCLYSFGNKLLSPSDFVTMWREIAGYICRQTDLCQELILFELFNEPIPVNHDWWKDNVCKEGECGDFKQVDSPHVYNTEYQIPAILAIREVEQHYQCRPHIILTTTYGNWSGVHAWNHTNMCKNPNSAKNYGPCNIEATKETDGVCGLTYCEDCTEWYPRNPLQELIQDLEEAGFTTNSHIIVSGHQYCDTNYSGIGWKSWVEDGKWGCDADCFNETKMNTWLSDTRESLRSKDGQYWKWFQTEGNVPCKPDTTGDKKTPPHNGPCYHAELYTKWLHKLYQDSTCLGFCIWNSNVMEFQQNSIGTNSLGDPFDEYKKVFRNNDYGYTWTDGTKLRGYYAAN